VVSRGSSTLHLAPRATASGIYDVKIVPKYILKEHFGPLVFALSALTSLLLLNFIARRFGELVGKGLSWTVILEFMVLSVPFTLAMTLPMAVLVATLHAFSRFASENEITAFKASGVSMQRLVAPVIGASVVLALMMVVFNDQVLPRANHRLANLQSDIARVKPTLALQEQVINEIVRGQLYLRAARIESGTNRMRDVTIYDLSNRKSRRTILAESGDLAFSETGEDLLLSLYDGHSTEIGADNPEQLQRSFFTRDMIRVRGVATRLDRDDGAPSYKSDREMTVCELLMRSRISRADRDSAFIRLQTMLEPNESARKQPPREIEGLSAIYCGIIGAFKEFDVVQEAGAAVPQAVPATSGAPAQQELPPEYNAIRAEGTRFDVSAAQSMMDRFRVEIEKKFSIAFSCIVFVLLGAPIALRFPRGGVGLTIGVSLGVFAIYYVGLLLGEALADRALVDPLIAMWGTNVLLGIVGVVLTIRLGSEGSTSRGSETSEWWSRVMDQLKARWQRLRPGRA
jgi:lipopolysaccharide export system permease protein